MATALAFDIRAAEESVDSSESWMSIYTALARYGHCAGGGMAEGFTDAVVRLRVSDRSSLPTAASIAQEHPAFRAFLRRHGDASTDAGELESIGAAQSRAGVPRCASSARAWVTAARTWAGAVPPM